MNVLCANFRGQLVGEIRAADKVAHVSSELDDQAGKLNRDRAMRRAPLLQCLSVGLEMGA